MNIIFDLDGTLICAKERLYRLFSDLVPEAKLTFDQYWQFKHARMSNLDILGSRLGFDEAMLRQFEANWMSLIEDEEYLCLDTPINGALECLEVLAAENSLYLCTARQSVSRAKEQLEKLGFAAFFEKLLVTQQSVTKESLILGEVANLSGRDWIIGDTGKDIETGKLLKMNTCAVLSGFMNELNLIKYEPDKLLADVSLLPEFFSTIS